VSLVYIMLVVYVITSSTQFKEEEKKSTLHKTITRKGPHL